MISLSSHSVPLLFGVGASKQLGEKAKSFGMTNALIVTDKGVVDAGLIAPLVANLKEAGVASVVYDGVLPDPPEHIIEEAAIVGRENKVDGVIGIGGGSSMDAAKAVNILQTNPSPIAQWAKTPPPEAVLPLLLVATTAGTGSEVTKVSVVTNSETGMKYGVSPEAGYTKVAIVDPELYVGMPLMPSVYVAFDAYTHSVDTICHNNPEMHATTYAEKSIRNVHKYLPVLKEDPKNIKAREGLAYAATLGGYAINGAMCHLTHGVGHTMGSIFHLPHGLCCALCLPQILEHYAVWMPDRVRIVADAMGLELPENISDEELGKLVSQNALNFMKSCGLPNMKELGLKLEDVLEIAPLMTQDVTSMLFPRIFPASKFAEIITKAYDQ